MTAIMCVDYENKQTGKDARDLAASWHGIRWTNRGYLPWFPHSTFSIAVIVYVLERPELHTHFLTSRDLNSLDC